METPKWKRFETLAYEIQKELAGNAQVTLDDSIMGMDSKASRQIDISIREQIGQYAILVIIDCKDLQDPVDVKGMEEFSGMVLDVRANKGAMISSNGFTDDAISVAKTHGIDTFRLIDTEAVDWINYVAIPVLLQRTYLESYQLEFSGTGRILLPASSEELADLGLVSESGSFLGSAKKVLHAKWDKREISREPGIFEVMVGKALTVEFAGHKSIVDVSANVKVSIRYYFGPLPIHVRGLQDVKDGKLITKRFRTDFIDPSKIEKGLAPGWTKLVDPSNLSVKPVVRLSYEDCYTDEIEPEQEADGQA